MSANSPMPISTRITDPLRQVAQRQWTVLAARGVLQTLAISLGVLLAVSLLLGYLPGIPMPLRVVAALAAWGAVIWAAVHSLRPALHRWSLSRAAQHVETFSPGSQERISSAVELSEADERFRGSPELVAHLVKQAEQDAGKVNATAVVPMGSVARWAMAAVPVLVLWMFFALNSHTQYQVFRGLFSMLTPWKSAPVQLADIVVNPGDVTVAQGDSLKIDVTLSARGKAADKATLVQTFATGQSLKENLDQVQARQFTRSLENLQQSFKYRISTNLRGQSPEYTVTVNPRPAIARLDVHYDYPKYTDLPARNLVANDGNIDAVVGTHITLSINTTDSVVPDKSQLVFDEGKGTEKAVPLTATADKNVYQAKFDVAQNGDYRIKLLNQYSLANKDDAARAVTAQVDQAPVVTIASPKDQITVRPDDDVLVMYLASDDFGVARLEALITIDDKPEHTIPVTIHSKNRKNIKDTWTLSVPALLRQAGVPEATRVSYQLKVTDNRDPDPQTGLSARQTLLVSKNEQKSFADKLNEIRKEDLQAAIKKAIERLQTNDQKFAPVIYLDPKTVLTAEQRKLANDVRDGLGSTGKSLALAASDFLDTPFADVAKAAKNIADTGIAHAAEDAAKTGLDADTPATRKIDADQSHKEIVDAITELQKLLLKAEEAQKKAEAAEALKEAARKQAEVAKQTAEHPEKQDENRQKQQEAIQKLQEALQKDNAIQNKEAQQLAQKLAELENKIEQEQAKQTDLQQQAQKQEEKQQAEQNASALAQEQKKLNEEVQKFAKEDKAALDQAKAPTPDQNQQNQLVQNIEKNQLQQAAQEAQQQADQLKQDAQKLEAQAKNADANAQPATDQQKDQQKQDQQNQQAAQQDANQAAQAAQNLQNQEKQNAQPNADAAQQAAQAAEKAAQAIQQQADKIEKQNQDGAKNADVQKAAEAAKADAQQAQADAQAAAQAQNQADAQKDADKAAQELAKAGQELQQAAQAEAKADQAAAQQQNQQAAAQAADQAQALADKQDAIAQALKQDAQAQADAAQNAATPQQAAQDQKALADQTQQAQQAAQALAQQADAQKDAALADRAKDAAQALAQAAADQQQAAQADAQNKPADAAAAQADAQQQLAKADQALRGQPDPAQAQADAGQPGQPDAAQPGQPDQGQPGQPDQGQGKPEQGQPGQGQPEQGQPGQGPPQQSAAQATQEAVQAQQQAAQQPNPGAAAEAAQALAQAAQAAEQGLPGQGQPEQGQPGQEPGTEPGKDPSKVPGQTPDSKTGISSAADGGNNQPPASVQALGISASDWAKLPPLMQKELMNASQQSGPPSYKEMIKNYYIRVSKMQTRGADASLKQ